ncbi:site-specific integrase [Leptolyngbya sp. FACHB-321]|uniref:site-specific integrase n=1 Tax=Leptolyngbya sp. FACHB-321 TaxID=2692807 RepID=UPI00168545EF|nr:site-specific integrase [Leptolyngbya sp. FACHB-321]MBD2036912.1 site-specific integrase [Leptolyngbya sp. FACHB-321]
MTSITLKEALLQYKTHLDATRSPQPAANCFNQTKSAVTRYLLTGMGYPPPAGRKPTKAETEQVEQALQSICLEQLGRALVDLDKGFDALQSNETQRQSNRSRIAAFLKWVEEEGLLPRKGRQQRTHRCPQINLGRGAHTQKRLTVRDHKLPYGLIAVKPKEVELATKIRADPLATEEEKQWVEEIEQRLALDANAENLYEFLTKERFAHRQDNPVSPSTGRLHIKHLRLFLGWRHYITGVPLEQLAFDVLMPHVQLPDEDEDDSSVIKAAKKAIKKIEADLDQELVSFQDFLEHERESQSPHTPQHYLKAIEKSLRCQYHREAKDTTYSNVPGMGVIQKHRAALRQKEAAHDGVVDLTLKWLDLPDVLKKIVTPLRQECEFRVMSGNQRPLSSIAASFQRYAVWGVLTYEPPRRQEEWRRAKLTSSCLLTDKPQGAAVGQCIHPLPPQKARYNRTEKYYPYLHKADGVWLLDHTEFSYKTAKTYKKQSLEIPNVPFPDGKYFYDYLEAFLYGYYRDQQGNWRSAGELNAPPGANWKLYSLRMTFNPQPVLVGKAGKQQVAMPQGVFVQPQEGTAYDTVGFSQVIGKAAHRLTGQRLTPHLLRDIYATWFLDQGYTSQQISSLAYAMGHSEAMLRRKYDKRKANQKRRAAQEAVSAIVSEHTK